MRIVRIIVIIVLILLIAFLLSSVFRPGKPSVTSSQASRPLSGWTHPTFDKSQYEFQKGMCYLTTQPMRYASAGSDKSLQEMKKTGTQWVAIIPVWYQQGVATTDIFPNESTVTDVSVIHAIKKAHELGYKVMLKPHLDIINVSDGSWRGDIGISSDDDTWRVWFESYKKFILHYTNIARENNVEIFCIGTELVYASTQHGEMWKEYVIDPVREAYKGPLTYAANWDEEYMKVKFWAMLDYIGIDAYFPLSDEARPTFEQLMAGWNEWVKEMETLQAAVDKPVIFPEIGYCSVKYTAKTPFEEPARGGIDLDLQADCYRAVYETFWGKGWFYGMYWWKWGTDTRLGGANNRGYYIQNKPAEKVVTTWYTTKPVPRKKY